MALRISVLGLLILGAVPLFAQSTKPSGPQPPSSIMSPGYVPVHVFDPARNAAADIEQAIAEAQRTGKRIILEVGGDWCPWCHVLHKFLLEHSDLVEIRDKNFITVAVYYGNENKNVQTLSRYPKTLGIPHMFVLERDGSLLHSQHVVELKTRNSYDPEKIREFLGKWSPHSEISDKVDAKPTSQTK